MMVRFPNFQPMGLLQEGAAILGVQLPPQALEQFRVYLEELRRWNTRVNLTGLKTERDIIVKHFLDSLAVLPFLGDAASLADLGSGPGFPGLALKLVRPEMALTLVEARAKKAAFLEYLVALLHLEGVEVAQVHLVPALARKWGPRFEAVTSRAAFPLARFLELAAPLLLLGGRVLALKGPNLAAEEMDAARKQCGSLGLGPLEIHHYSLPFSEEPRILVVARHF
ncbi:MAG: 16S rRNA (guanine(527)-N(7))-methyltransferase RsmG [Deltaproteobacteria bacterium]|nr:MAG: 16S rRNA (guanine(527)-N(7))-methyltransferase RsmG [Deltaproteobacteria bacterium]